MPRLYILQSIIRKIAGPRSYLLIKWNEEGKVETFKEREDHLILFSSDEEKGKYVYSYKNCAYGEKDAIEEYTTTPGNPSFEHQDFKTFDEFVKEDKIKPMYLIYQQYRDRLKETEEAVEKFKLDVHKVMLVNNEDFLCREDHYRENQADYIAFEATISVANELSLWDTHKDKLERYLADFDQTCYHLAPKIFWKHYTDWDKVEFTSVDRKILRWILTDEIETIDCEEVMESLRYLEKD